MIFYLLNSFLGTPAGYHGPQQHIVLHLFDVADFRHIGVRDDFTQFVPQRFRVPEQLPYQKDQFRAKDTDNGTLPGSPTQG